MTNNKFQKVWFPGGTQRVKKLNLDKFIRAAFPGWILAVNFGGWKQLVSQEPLWYYESCFQESSSKKLKFIDGNYCFDYLYSQIIFQTHQFFKWMTHDQNKFQKVWLTRGVTPRVIKQLEDDVSPPAMTFGWAQPHLTFDRWTDERTDRNLLGMACASICLSILSSVTDGQTESNAHKPTMQYAQVASKQRHYENSVRATGTILVSFFPSAPKLMVHLKNAMCTISLIEVTSLKYT